VICPVRIPDYAAGCMCFFSVAGILPAVRGRDALDTNLQRSLWMVIPYGLKIRCHGVGFDLFDVLAARNNACYGRMFQTPCHGPVDHRYALWDFVFEVCYLLKNFLPFFLVMPGASDIRAGELRIFAVFAAQSITRAIRCSLICPIRPSEPCANPDYPSDWGRSRPPACRSLSYAGLST